MTPVFTRDDGKTLRVIEGWRQQLLAAPRVSVQPKGEWIAADYRAAASKKVRHLNKFLAEFAQLGGRLEDARVLEVGCGAGIDCLLMALRPVDSVIGIDRQFPLFEPSTGGHQTRRLASEVLTVIGAADDLDTVLRQRPIRFSMMDATALAFPKHHFDLLRSRAAMEHIIPPETALAEMARVVRPGGLIHHEIDPFFWLKGCHKGGIIDIPWAHARMTPDEYQRFVASSEGEAKAAKRSRHLKTLNQFTPRQWRATLEAGPFEILQWKEEHWPLAESLLAQHPDVRDTLLDGIGPEDLTCRSIHVWLRNPRATTH